VAASSGTAPAARAGIARSLLHHGVELGEEVLQIPHLTLTGVEDSTGAWLSVVAEVSTTTIKAGRRCSKGSW
jgi:hypothetical protein